MVCYIRGAMLSSSEVGTTRNRENLFCGICQQLAKNIIKDPCTVGYYLLSLSPEAPEKEGMGSHAVNSRGQ